MLVIRAYPGFIGPLLGSGIAAGLGCRCWDLSELICSGWDMRVLDGSEV